MRRSSHGRKTKRERREKEGTDSRKNDLVYEAGASARRCPLKWEETYHVGKTETSMFSNK
jgi:hypothetical protein